MSQKPTVVGGCYCGKIRYQTTGPIYGLTFCYCLMCQIVHGGPFAPFTNVKREHLQWLKSDDLVELKLSDYATRTVCGSCHAPISMVYHGKPDEVGLVAVTINEEESTMAVPEVDGHIFVRRKPRWYKISDDAPQEMGLPERMKHYAPTDL
ncbi:Mss4-like protein [Aspergillus alliaceus]|uniref:Mss4-like protein n=1 Tax=Petromyces alliaceus TaxID=209559 RepID=A0A5N7BW26_PETAA|nr:Mss4-like protein [Aspergillus alliaceus]